MEGSVGKVIANAPAGQIVTPQEPEPFLAEAGDDRDKGRGGEDPDIKKGLPDEAGHVPIRDRGHEIPGDIAVDDVQRIRRAEELDQRGEDEFGLPADFGLRKGSDRARKSRSGRLQRNGLRIHELSFGRSGDPAGDRLKRDSTPPSGPRLAWRQDRTDGPRSKTKRPAPLWKCHGKRTIWSRKRSRSAGVAEGRPAILSRDRGGSF